MALICCIWPRYLRPDVPKALIKNRTQGKAVIWMLCKQVQDRVCSDRRLSANGFALVLEICLAVGVIRKRKITLQSQNSLHLI